MLMKRMLIIEMKSCDGLGLAREVWSENVHRILGNFVKLSNKNKLFTMTKYTQNACSMVGQRKSTSQHRLRAGKRKVPFIRKRLAFDLLSRRNNSLQDIFPTGQLYYRWLRFLLEPFPRDLFSFVARAFRCSFASRLALRLA